MAQNDLPPVPRVAYVDPADDPLVLPPADGIPPKQPPSRFRELLPWILMAVCGVLLIGGLGVWYFTRSSSKPVPTVVGFRIDEAVTRLQDDGFKAEIARQANARQAGVVFGQNPAAATMENKGSTVKLLVSKGPSRATVPNAVGVAQSDARDRLVNAGFKVTTAEVFSDLPLGTVVAQDPPAGDRVSPGTKVRLNVSKGSASVDVPSEIGTTVDAARADLTSKGFTPVVTSVQSDSPADTVVDQTPSGGQARKGSNVQLSVSDGSQTTTTTTTESTTTVTAPTTSNSTPTTSNSTPTNTTVTTG